MILEFKIDNLFRVGISSKSKACSFAGPVTRDATTYLERHLQNYCQSDFLLELGLLLGIDSSKSTPVLSDDEIRLIDLFSYH